MPEDDERTELEILPPGPEVLAPPELTPEVQTDPTLLAQSRRAAAELSPKLPTEQLQPRATTRRDLIPGPRYAVIISSHVPASGGIVCGANTLPRLLWNFTRMLWRYRRYLRQR